MNGGESRVLWVPEFDADLRAAADPDLLAEPAPGLEPPPGPNPPARTDPAGEPPGPRPLTSPPGRRPAGDDRMAPRLRPGATLGRRDESTELPEPTETARSGSTGKTGRRVPRSAKVVVAGGFGVGKTTFVGSVSEIPPLTTEAARTAAAFGVDASAGLRSKKATTVAMDFGRVTIDRSLVVYLFGTPGQERFSFMWDDIVGGSLGAVVLVDTRRLEECYPAVDYFEARGLPFVIGVNRFDGAPEHDPGEVRDALAVPADVPILQVDARRGESAKYALLALLATLRGRVRVRAPRRSDLVAPGALSGAGSAQSNRTMGWYRPAGGGPSPNGGS